METGKPGLASAPVHISSVAAQTEKRMDIQAPLTAVYIHTVPAVPAQPYPPPHAAAREPATLHLAMPPLYSKETLPFLTLHIAGGLQSQPGLSLAAAGPAARPKSAGKHVCPHCGRDCMKPSVLEKHLRCHTGERPYPCNTCGVSFKTQSNLYKHKRTQAHARLSSESEQSSLSSIDSMSNSRETCASSLSLDERSNESGTMEKDATLHAAELTCPASTAKTYSVKTQGSVCEQGLLTPAGQLTEANQSAKVSIEGEKQRTDNEKPPLTASRHLPLQRQEATLFSKQWESSVSRGKSQSHESTDSGFGESSDHYPSPGCVLPEQSMDCLTESTKEHLEDTTSTQAPPEPGQGGQEPKSTVREQEQKTLEERISKLISENSAVVEDKQLENVRPRKTVLSKQGSIDLPMPYTYKDSFHFDMRISKTPNVGSQRNKKPDFYSSVPTQRSNTMEHAPLTRSNSLPFSVTLLQPERSSPTSSHQSDYVTLVRRGSSGQINPTGFTIKPVNQHSSTHRPLVRQTAVDGNHATDGLFMNSSVEEACTGSLSCDGDGGDICGEPSIRKFRRKKAQKFAYNKWYMYGGGTFKKLYSAEKGGDDGAVKGRKGLTNPEHEVVQGLQKRSSAVHKEAVTTTGSIVTFTSSSATACHSGCPPATQSPLSAEDLNLKTSQLQTSCSSLKTPLSRNMSLSVLPLSSTGSLVSKQTDSMNRAEAGRRIDEDKQTDFTLLLCGAQIPSDRKKQKTDDKINCPLQMETQPNIPTHPLPSVIGSVPQQDTNLSHINPQKNQKHPQLKSALFPACIINANTMSVSTSPATSSPPTAKASFLPKYQLKLPNAAEPDSNPSLHAMDEPSGGDAAVTLSHIEQISPSVKTYEKRCGDTVTSLLMQTCDIKRTNALSATQGQLLIPCVATALCQTPTPRLNPKITPSLALVHRPFSTKTTTCLQNYQAGLCSTSIQPSKSAGGSAPMLSPRPVAPTIATANHQSPAAVITAFSQGQLNSNPPLSLTQLAPASQFSPVNCTYSSSNTPVQPCHIVPFDQMQPDAQNVFHVHTADLQICLQIISDEQLALIEPQIERQALSQRRDIDAVNQNKAESPATMERSKDGKDHQKGLDQTQSLPTLNAERIKPPLSVQFGKAEPSLHPAEHSDSTQATVSAKSTPPEVLGSSLRPHKYGHVNMVTVTQSSTGDVMSTAASLKGAKSEGSQTSEEENAHSLNSCAEEQLLLDRRPSQGGVTSQTLSGQRKLRGSSLSPSTKSPDSMRSEKLGKVSQHEPTHQAASFNFSIKKATGEASTYKSSRLESGESQPALQVGFTQASSAACAAELSGPVFSFSSNKCKASRQMNQHTSIYCMNPAESTSSQALYSFKHTNMGCDRVEPSQEMTPCESENVISFGHSEKQMAQFISGSSNIQADRPKDVPAAEFMEGSCLLGAAAQKELPTLGHGPDSTDWRSRQNLEAGKANLPWMERRGGRGSAGEDKNRGIKTDESSGQQDKAQPDCTYTLLPERTKPEGQDRTVKVDSSKNSWLTEQHVQHLSQTHSGMSEYPPLSHPQTPSKSNNLNPSVSSSQSSLFTSPQHKLEMSSLCLSQQHWETTSIHNPPTQVFCEPDPCQHITAQAQLIDTQNAMSQVQSSTQQTHTTSHQDQKQVSITPVQPAHAAAGNCTTGSCCVKLGGHKSPSDSPDVSTAPSNQQSQLSSSVPVNKAAVGVSGETLTPNNNILDNKTLLLSEPFTYPQHDGNQDTKDKPPNDYMSQSSASGRPDITNNYHQCFFLSGQLHGYQPADGPTSGVRPVQSCQDYTDDTSSSDDEGKLIIEL